MSRSDDFDPRRWRTARANDAGVEPEIAAAIRGLGQPRPVDDVRVAHLRQDILQRRAGSRRVARASMGFALRRPSWILAGACVLLSSVTTAIAGAFLRYERRSSSGTAMSDAKEAGGPRARARHQGPRRWRLAVQAPTVLDLSVVDDQAQIEVVDGQVELSGHAVGESMRIDGGQAWRESSNAVVARRTDNSARTAPAAPIGPVAPTLPAVVGAMPAAPPAVAPRRRASAGSLPARPRRAETLPAPPASQPPPWGDPIHSPALATGDAGEAEALADALRALRTSSDARLALQKLDERDRRFPGGALQREAALARAEAFLALGEQAHALAALDRVSLGEAGGDRPVALARAELRAAAGRCTDAVADFGRVLANRAGDEMDARALYGRGACHLASGDRARARSDFLDYTQGFPDGAQRASVARALASLAH